MEPTAQAIREMRLASSYLDDLDSAIKAFPREYFSYDHLSGKAIAEKEHLIRDLLENASAGAFAAIDGAQQAGTDESELRDLFGRAHRLTGVLWSAMSFNWLAIPIGGREGSHTKERQRALRLAVEHFQEAASLESGADQADSLYRLAVALRISGRLDEAYATFQRIVDTWPDSETAINAMKAQARMEKARRDTTSSADTNAARSDSSPRSRAREDTSRTGSTVEADSHAVQSQPKEPVLYDEAKLQECLAYRTKVRRLLVIVGLPLVLSWLGVLHISAGWQFLNLVAEGILGLVAWGNEAQIKEQREAKTREERDSAKAVRGDVPASESESET